eukprot:TRINITY_DN609_c0_g1_i2.p1 TRINITY_DN609_c0_g1~~TRINITY_DN609_c0_g1_i2.p1  ORF type:complete len:636 (+),score=95.03 TRINITY_DN609_c0_g1_i2:230-2137(+)
MNDREYQAIDFPGLYCGRVLFGPVVYPETRKLVSHYDAKFEHQSHRGFGSYLVTGFQRLHPGQTTKITKADYDSFVATLAFGRAAHGKRRLCGFISTLPNAAPHFVCAALQRKEIALSDIWKGRFNPFDKVSPKHPLFPQRLEAVLKQMIAALQEVRTMQKDSLPTKWLSIPKEQQVVVHGDLKPTNMLWKVKEQVIAIADWDSAKLIPAAGVDVPPTGFTAEFLSPEGEHYTTPGQDMFAIVMSALAVASGRFTEAVDPKFFVEVYIACPRLRALFDRTVAPGHHLLGRPDPTEALNLIPMSVEESEGIVRVLMEASMEFDAPVFSRVPPPRRLLSELDSSLIEQALHPVNQAYCAQFGAAMLNLKTEMQIGLQHGSDLESQVVNQPPPRELESTNDGVFRIQGSANGWPGDESLQSHSHQPTPSFANSTLEHVTTDESIRKKRERPEGGPDMDDMEAVKLPLPLAKRSKSDGPLTADPLVRVHSGQHDEGKGFIAATIVQGASLALPAPHMSQVKKYLESISEEVKKRVVDTFVKHVIASSGPLEHTLRTSSTGLLRDYMLNSFLKYTSTDTVPLAKVKKLFSKEFHTQVELHIAKSTETLMSLLGEKISLTPTEFSEWVGARLDSELHLIAE